MMNRRVDAAPVVVADTDDQRSVQRQLVAEERQRPDLSALHVLDGLGRRRPGRDDRVALAAGTSRVTVL